MKAMRTRVLAVIGCLSLAAAALALTHAPLDAQAQKPAAPAKAAAAAKAAIPRLADGHPDFQGFYDVSTMTPVDRPRGVKNLVLTEQEAVAMERYEAQRQVKNDAPLAGDRSAPPVGGENTAPKTYLEFLEAAGGGVVGGYNNFWLAGGDQVIRVDGQPRSSLIIDPPDGQVPPMKPEAQKRNAAFLAGAVAPDAGETGGASPPGAFDGPESRPLAERCLLGFLNTSGPPTLPNYFYNNMKQIVQTKDTILILDRDGARRPRHPHERRAPAADHPQVDGRLGRHTGKATRWSSTPPTSRTRRSSAVRARTCTSSSASRAPARTRSSIGSRSRIRRRGTSRGPASTRGTRPNENLYEYACHEGNYSLGGMLRGARQKEADDAKKSKQ